MAAIRSPFRMALYVSFLLLPHFSITAQQNQQAADAPRGVVKSATRLVVVDVVATDSKGQPVLDLQSTDIIVSEDGRPQKIGDFSLQRPGVAPVETAVLPPNVVTNVPRFKATSLNMLLLTHTKSGFTRPAYSLYPPSHFLARNPPVTPQ